MPVLNSIYNASMALLRSVNLAKPVIERGQASQGQGQNASEQDAQNGGAQSPLDLSTATIIPTIDPRSQLNQQNSDPAVSLGQETSHDQNGSECPATSSTAVDTNLANHFDSNGAAFSPESSRTPSIHTSASWINSAPPRVNLTKAPRRPRLNESASETESEIEGDLRHNTHPVSTRPFRPKNRYLPGPNRPVSTPSAPPMTPAASSAGRAACTPPGGTPGEAGVGSAPVHEGHIQYFENQLKLIREAQRKQTGLHDQQVSDQKVPTTFQRSNDAVYQMLDCEEYFYLCPIATEVVDAPSGRRSGEESISNSLAHGNQVLYPESLYENQMMLSTGHNGQPSKQKLSATGQNVQFSIANPQVANQTSPVTGQNACFETSGDLLTEKMNTSVIDDIRALYSKIERQELIYAQLQLEITQVRQKAQKIRNSAHLMPQHPDPVSQGNFKLEAIIVSDSLYSQRSPSERNTPDVTQAKSHPRSVPYGSYGSQAQYSGGEDYWKQPHAMYTTTQFMSSSAPSSQAHSDRETSAQNFEDGRVQPVSLRTFSNDIPLREQYQDQDDATTGKTGQSAPKFTCNEIINLFKSALQYYTPPEIECGYCAESGHDKFQCQKRQEDVANGWIHPMAWRKTKPRKFDDPRDKAIHDISEILRSLENGRNYPVPKETASPAEKTTVGRSKKQCFMCGEFGHIQYSCRMFFEYVTKGMIIPPVKWRPPKEFRNDTPSE